MSNQSGVGGGDHHHYACIQPSNTSSPTCHLLLCHHEPNVRVVLLHKVFLSGRADRDEVEHANQEEGDVLSND